jgi:hypothetical protein
MNLDGENTKTPAHNPLSVDILDQPTRADEVEKGGRWDCQGAVVAGEVPVV